MTTTGPDQRPVTERAPRKPRPSLFGVLTLTAAVLLTIVTAWDWEYGVGLSLSEIWDGFTRPNSPMRGLLNPDFGQITSDRSRSAFIETFRMAVLGTAAGGLVALPLALWSTGYGAPNRVVKHVVRTFNNVIRAFPDLLWALLFVAAVGIGALPGLLALFFFSIAVVTKLTADTLDGIDMGPIEAAHASGASHTQMLRSAVVPQILPAYTSFFMYGFELNLRASAVIGLVGAGGIGRRLEFFRGRGDWEEVWGLVFMFLIVVFVVEQLSQILRRRLV
ncbi:MAG: phosphonate ABC transporter, permease protein PhnE [Ilumatobacteraceae bacterium]